MLPDTTFGEIAEPADTGLAGAAIADELAIRAIPALAAKNVRTARIIKLQPRKDIGHDALCEITVYQSYLFQTSVKSR